MSYISRWKVLVVFAVCIFGILYAMPNVLDKNSKAWMESHLPSWMPRNTVNLGLDLQGGSHLLLQVDLASVIRDHADGLGQAVRPDLRKQKIGYTQIAVIPEGGLRITLRDAKDGEAVRKALRSLDRDLDFKDSGAVVEARFTDAAIKRIEDSAIEQSIEIVRRRIDESGTKEPAILRQGKDRIIVQLPGVGDPQHVKELLGRTAKLTFHLVDTTGTAGGTVSLPMQNEQNQTIPIQRQAILTGEMLRDAQPNFNEGAPVVSFSLDAIGARRFCDVTRDNVNKPFAIVLDKEVISAPNIREPICGGQAQISGDFTVQEVNDLSLLLRAGALPAPLHVIEERTVGPTLGADSVQAGMKACLFAFLFVVIYMTMIYGLFGAFASFALMFNMILIIAVMSTLQAILTLPGIAGIVLTIGLAVDANVLIFERIKEELRDGKSVMSALDAGYTRARTTIIDSNLTALIAALILFSFGTGPIKGFAVTMCIGVVTSYFCALMLTQLIILTWVRWKKPKEIRA